MCLSKLSKIFIRFDLYPINTASKYTIKYLMFGKKFRFRVPFMKEKKLMLSVIRFSLLNVVLVSVSVSDLNQNIGFGHYMDIKFAPIKILLNYTLPRPSEISEKNVST